MADETGEKSKGRGMGRMIVTAVFLLPVIGVLLPTCLVLLVGMLPTAVAYMIDRGRDKCLTITVGLLNFCGNLPGVIDLWSNAQAYDAAVAVATDPMSLLMAYAAAALGWMISFALPPVVGTFYGVVTHHRIHAIQRRQVVLVESWGEEVAGDRRPG